MKAAAKEFARIVGALSVFLALEAIASGGGGSAARLVGLVTGDRLTLTSTSGAALTATGGSGGPGVTATGGGGSGNGRYGIVGNAPSLADGTAIIGFGINNTSSVGVRGDGSATGTGVYGAAGNGGIGVKAENLSGGYSLSVLTDTTGPIKAPIHIDPQDAEPTGAHVVGDMYVTSAGVLKICTAAGTPGTWTTVGTQSP